MKKINSKFQIQGIVGKSGDVDVFMGFFDAASLFTCSFTDILQEDTGAGYQRPYNKRHSQDFKKYISLPGTSTPPLIFNLRCDLPSGWKITADGTGRATLHLDSTNKPLSQVDCQHRLGELQSSNIPLAFMAFIGLDLKSEMAMFNVINGKAKGLSSSLTDYHESRLLNDLICQAPHLYIARKLNEDPFSPWYQMVRYGGETTSGLKRRTSLRMMQIAVRGFLCKVDQRQGSDTEKNYETIANFWNAVRDIFPSEWSDHRHHLLTKGIGLYAMTQVLVACVIEFTDSSYGKEFFVEKLCVLKGKLDWTSNGTFASANGRKGANEVYRVVREELEF